MLVGILGTGCNDEQKDQLQEVSKYLKDANNPVVQIQTSQGDMFIELYENDAPGSVGNFLAYVNDGFYTDTIFHRVIKGFMIQGGGFKAGLVPKFKGVRPAIHNEATNGLKNYTGTIAMARTADVHSATSQFFINVVDNGHLDHQAATDAMYGYAVFGKVVYGMDVVSNIENVSTHSVGAMRDVPREAIKIHRISIIRM
ncbi:MAG: hypothetical protein CL521_01455 [Actinobacteria bacterium]|nr:hypothetical protein [Actinomycetota bacterium]